MIMPYLYLFVSLSAITLYFVVVSAQFLVFTDRVRYISAVQWAALLAVGMHAWWLYHVIAGQNISMVNLFSFILWVMGIVLVARGMRHNQNVSLLVFPLSALSILLALFFPAHSIVRMISGHTGQWLHIWLSTITLSIICIAALQALLLYVQDILLHRHYFPHLIKKMPALESMEHFLFQVMTIGFILLTVLCVSSAYFFSDIFRPPLLQKTALALFTWVVFFILLLGRRFFGWRGRKAVGYTMTGFVLLLLLYFGSSL
jgi:ABC-type uncharacterized transport system permease subunit